MLQSEISTDSQSEQGIFTKDLIAPAKNIWQYLALIFLMSAISIPFTWSNSSWDDPRKVALALTWSFAIWLTQIVGHTIIIKWLDSKIPWMKKPLLRGILGLISMVIYASVAFIFVQIIMKYIVYQELPSGSIIRMIENSWFAVKMAFIVSFVGTFFGFLSAWRKSEIEKERLNTEMMVQKYNALQNQINPHFLFNSFNVLSELVYENQDLAVKFIQQLSELYRYVLSAKSEDLVPLQKELDFIESFAFLLKTRFENQLEISIDVEAQEGEHLIPMSLQLLLENAVKHNEATTASPLKISVTRVGKNLEVSNNLQLKKAADSTKTGLSNIKERYAYLSGKQIEIEQTADHFTVRIPIIDVKQK